MRGGGRRVADRAAETDQGRRGGRLGSELRIDSPHVEPALNVQRGARRGAQAAGSVVLGVLLALAISRLSQQVPLNSDQASSALEGWALAHATSC